VLVDKWLSVLNARKSGTSAASSSGRTFAMNVSQIYDVDSEPVEMDINLVKEAAN
jgi:hypothetical protein